MASQVGGLIRDQNLNVHCYGAPQKAQKKGGLGGRKPLGDLSNSVKPVITQSLKSKISQDFAASKITSDLSILKPTEKGQMGTRKALSDLSNSVKPLTKSKVPQDFAAGVGKKKNISNAANKEHTGIRKPLSDISNSGKPHLYQAEKKNQSKLDVVTEKPIHLSESDIAEEGFLHNHDECIKAQTGVMEMNQFLQILGLDNGFSKPSSPPPSMPSSTSKPESPLRYMELDEMVVDTIEEDFVSWDRRLSSKLSYSPPSTTPQSPNRLWDWDWQEPSFMLIESPKLP